MWPAGQSFWDHSDPSTPCKTLKIYLKWMETQHTLFAIEVQTKPRWGNKLKGSLISKTQLLRQSDFFPCHSPLHGFECTHTFISIALSSSHWCRKWLVFSRAENRNSYLSVFPFDFAATTFSFTHLNQHPSDDSRVCNCRGNRGWRAWVSCSEHFICTEILLKGLT